MFGHSQLLFQLAVFLNPLHFFSEFGLPFHPEDRPACSSETSANNIRLQVVVFLKGVNTSFVF
jgi:hypothetical protein